MPEYLRSQSLHGLPSNTQVPQKRLATFVVLAAINPWSKYPKINGIAVGLPWLGGCPVALHPPCMLSLLLMLSLGTLEACSLLTLLLVSSPQLFGGFRSPTLVLASSHPDFSPASAALFSWPAC